MNSSQAVKQFGVTQIILYHLLPGVPVLLGAILLSNPSFGFGLLIFLSFDYFICNMDGAGFMVDYESICP